MNSVGEFLLDELLHQGALDPTEYTQSNTRLTEEEDLTTDKEKKERRRRGRRKYDECCNPVSHTT